MAACETYTVQSGDTLSAIGEWFHIPWRQLAESNHIDNPNVIHPNQVIRLVSDHPVNRVYTVQSGDTLSGIGQRYHVNWQKLAHYNHIPDPNRIYAGQTICIPY